ncbi:helix-turn-helix transcriptional regulator [Paenibacillus sp. P22]|uniref:helix-turn-helix transcriptional regulator n=1 Tax=Paenibacillus sp. P22 TaxID=483908 RepID=UPI00038FD05A|nr:Helix-turn-helix domain protein [Paenibacillus sp. P22]
MKIKVGRCRIREFRLALGWTQENLSERSGVGRTSISQYETKSHGEGMPLVTAVALADALGVSPRDLYEWLNEE